MNVTGHSATQPWTIYSLRPPTSDDAPFDSKKTGMVAAGDMEVHPLPSPSAALSRAMRRFPSLPLKAEINRLCRSYNAEVLSALAEGIEYLIVKPRKRGRPKTDERKLATVTQKKKGTFPKIISKRFTNVQRKYHSLDLNAELEALRTKFPAAALTTVGTVIVAVLAGRLRRGRPRLQGLSGPSAQIRAFVQARRLSGRGDIEIARCLENELEAGQSKMGLRKRAQREVAGLNRRPGRFHVSLALATELWALTRAARQIERVAHRFSLTEDEANQCVELRKSRFMSRASWDTSV